MPPEPSKVNVLGPVTVTVKSPLAAVLPCTPETRTRAPVIRPCGVSVVIEMGLEVLAAEIPLPVILVHESNPEGT